MNKRLVIFPIICLFVISAWRLGFVSGEAYAGENLGYIGPYDLGEAASGGEKFNRNAGMLDFSGLSFKPWDIDGIYVDKRDKKPYTMMVYMNGSDLETDMGAATADIIEMQKSGLSSKNTNLVLFTGGTNRWNNSVIPENSCVVWEMSDGELKKLGEAGLRNMGDPGTLSSFIDFTVKNFPAEKLGLIMWDHGGGSIAGFGDDEIFNHSFLTLLDMNYAFEKSALKEQKLEFLGFDSCLMATVEMAVIASDYAKYLVASEDLEPYGGWNYRFLSVLNKNPQIGGARLGKVIADSFMERYSGSWGESLTISVTDLSKAGGVMKALGGLMEKCSASLSQGGEVSFKTLASRRGGTKTFGKGSPRDNVSDMVDIGDMAAKLSGLYPNEAAKVFSALKSGVIYNRHNSNADLKGLSAYYIYGGKEIGKYTLEMYKALGMDENYTSYLSDFYKLLKKNNAVTRSAARKREAYEDAGDDEIAGAELTMWQKAGDGGKTFIMTGIQSGTSTDKGEVIKNGVNSLWPKISGQGVCLYKINSTGNSALYAVPASLNGEDCDLIVMFCEEYPHGKILGARKEDGLVIQKGCDEIQKGDKLAFYYLTGSIDGKSGDWIRGKEFNADDELKIDWALPLGKKYYSLLLTDVQNNKSFTALKAMQ